MTERDKLILKLFAILMVIAVCMSALPFITLTHGVVVVLFGLCCTYAYSVPVKEAKIEEDESTREFLDNLAARTYNRAKERNNGGRENS